MSEELTATDVFEAVKISFRQSKDGYIVSFSVHPNDVPASLFTDPVGSRYSVGIVQLDTDMASKPPPSKAVQVAGMLCRNADFRSYLHARYRAPGGMDEEDAASFLHEVLNVQSRAELASKPQAAKTMMEIADEFRTWNSKHQGSRPNLDEF